jgi:hypothetical protein
MVTLMRTASFIALALLAACGGTNTGPNGAGAPTVSSTSPIDIATSVPTNARVFISFSEAMDPATLTSTTVRLEQGTTAVAGSVVPAADGMTVTFTPAAALAANTVYNATVTSDAKAEGGNALAANHAWSFTTGTTADTTAPTVSATNPAASATGVPLNARVSATFSKPMDPATITTSTFSISPSVAGAVAYGTAGTTATFAPSADFASNTAYTVTIATGARDLSGNALAAAATWGFTTGSSKALGPAPVSLGTAGNFVVLAKTAISSVPSSVVTGDLAVSPAAATFITGFSLVADSTNVFASSPQVTGKIYAADYAVPTPSNLTTAVSNMEAAYSDAAGRSNPDFLELGTGNIGGKTLAPGLYKWTSSVSIPADVVFAGGANDVWILQTTGDLTMDAAKHVTLSGGALAKNIFWQVAGIASFGAGSHFEGIVLAKTDIKLLTSASMNGRALSQTQVVLQQATLTQP